LNEGDYILLCSDGLWEMLSDEKIYQIVRNATSPHEACQALIEATNAAGGHDNIAAVLVRINNSVAKAKTDDDDTEKLSPISPA